MKLMNIKTFFRCVFSVILAAAFFSCSDITRQNDRDIDKGGSQIQSYETGSATVKMFVPDYYAMAEAATEGRAIAPQTSSVRLSAFNANTNEWNILDKVTLEGAEKTPVENAPAGFSGYVYTVQFTKVYVKSYAKGTLKVELLNSSGTVITSGTNEEAVTITTEEAASAVFYTLPSESYNSESYLNVGEMKFCSFIFRAETVYNLHLDVSEGSAYPDVVIFNSDGTLNSYYAVDSAEESVIPFEPCEKDTVRYIGVWADDGAYVSKYSIHLYTELTDFTFRDSSIGFWAGENYQINLSPVPSDAYLGKAEYSSDNENIIVSENGVISGDAEAEGVITVTYEGISHTISVNVYESATELTGVLSGDNLHWTEENSPYRVTGNILIEEGTELVVDPGVKVYFTGDYYLKMNGTINAQGTKEKPVLITRAASYAGTWGGVRIGGGSLSTANTYTYVSGNILAYVNICYASTPLSLSNPAYVDHCNFTDCTDYIYVTSNSVLINNVMESGISCHDWQPHIVNNMIYERFVVSDCYGKFLNNTIHNAVNVIYSTSVVIRANRFIGGTFECNSLSGLSFTGNNLEDFTGTILYIRDSHDSYKSYNFTGNYWGKTQTEELIANEATGEKNVSFIYDYRDDFNLTEVDYTGWQKEPIEGAGYMGDGFIAFDYTINGFNFNSGSYYPESKETDLTVAITPYYYSNNIAYVRIAQGYENLVASEWQTYSDNFSFVADTNALSDGYAPIYIQLKDSEGNISSAVCHKVPFDSPKIKTSLIDGTVYENPTASVGFDFSATDGGNLTCYEILLDGITIRQEETLYGWGSSCTFQSASDTSISCRLGLPCMAAGAHTVTLKVWDSAGNLTEETYSFVITNTNDTSSLAGVSYDTSTGKPLKDDRTIYLWHLDGSGAEENNSNATISSYTSAIGGFGGCASYVYTDGSIPIDVSGNNAYTVEFWSKGVKNIYIEKSSVFNTNIYKSGSNVYGNNCWCYETASGSETGDSISSPHISGDEWHYWAFTFDGTYAAIYCDGVLVRYYDDFSVTLNNNDNKLYIWSDYGGSYDEIRISNAARSGDEIAAYYAVAKDKIQ